jgi:hypothetical protein
MCTGVIAFRTDVIWIEVKGITSRNYLKFSKHIHWSILSSCSLVTLIKRGMTKPKIKTVENETISFFYLYFNKMYSLKRNNVNFSDLQTKLNHGFIANGVFMLNKLSCYKVVMFQTKGSLHLRRQTRRNIFL